MLARTSYPKPYVDAVRARVARVLKAYDKAKPAEPFAGEALADVILGLEIGDKIALDRKQVGALAEAFFDELEAKYHG